MRALLQIRRCVSLWLRNLSEIQDGSQPFRMTRPVPAYLIAIAIGDIDFASVGPRTGIYAEPCVLDAAKREFEDLEKLVSTVERLFGPYRWGRCKLLVLPPSFPFWRHGEPNCGL